MSLKNTQAQEIKKRLRVNIQQHPGSNQSRMTFQIDVPIDATLQQVIKDLRESGKIMVTSLNHVCVEGEQRVLQKEMKVEDLQQENKIFIKCFENRQPEKMENVIKNNAYLKTNTSINKELEDFRKLHNVVLVHSLIQNKVYNKIPEKQTNQITAQIFLVDGDDQKWIQVPCQSTDTYDNLEDKLHKLFQQNWKQYDRITQKVRVFTNQQPFTKKNKAFEVLNIINNKKVQFKVQRLFAGG